MSIRHLGPALSRRGALSAAAGSVGALLLGGKVARAQIPVATEAAGPKGGRTYYMFVQNAERGSFVPNAASPGLYTLTLEGVQPQTVYFSDRPVRDAGLSPMKRFLKGLGFSPKNPPNAAVVVAGADGRGDTLIVEIFSPRYDEHHHRLVYDARIVPEAKHPKRLSEFSRRQRDDKLPHRFGEASLFIDSCPNGGVLCTGGGLPPEGVTVANNLPCCWHWLGGCEYCGSQGDAYFNQICEQNVAGCSGDCNGEAQCLGL
jgi:hypothetical protein